MSLTAFDVISPVDETVVTSVGLAGPAELFTETKNVFISTEE